MFRRWHAFVCLAAIVLWAPLSSVHAQPTNLTAFDRSAARTEADIARLFGCKWKSAPMRVACHDIRHVGLRLELDINPANGLIDQVEIRAQLKRRKFTPEQRTSSDKVVISLLQYFTDGWPGGRGWATLVVEEAGAEEADATISIGGFVLSTGHARPNIEDGLELLLITISRKKS